MSTDVVINSGVAVGRRIVDRVVEIRHKRLDALGISVDLFVALLVRIRSATFQGVGKLFNQFRERALKRDRRIGTNASAGNGIGLGLGRHFQSPVCLCFALTTNIL